MKINILLLSHIIISIRGLQQKSDEYYDCIDPTRDVINSTDCTSIIIPESDGFKCCSMKIVFGTNVSYNCFALETEYTNNKTIFEEYLANRSLAPLFTSIGGEMEIDCGEEMKSTQEYEKLSDEYLNCFKSHVNGVDSPSDCHMYDIPEKESSKCCYLEIEQKHNNGSNIIDKRCYIIHNEYFTKEKNFNNYLLDKANLESLDQLKNISITINCKNYDVFYFKDTKSSSNDDNTRNSDELNSSNNANNDSSIGEEYIRKKDSGISTGAIVGIVIGCVVAVLIGLSIIFIYFRKKRNASVKESDSINEMNTNNKTQNNNAKA